jgi:CDP-glucose 4,6-dehydratase
MGRRIGAMEGLEVKPNGQFWSGKKVLVTGHTGFKGAWLSFWLKRLGAEVTGMALPAATTPNLFELLSLKTAIGGRILDIREATKVLAVVKELNPEIVFHLAAQALVRESYRTPLSTFETNFCGTANMLEAIRSSGGVRVAVVVTTDKVYRNFERTEPYSETDELGGHDPYSASKAATELLVASYRDSYLREADIAVATARAGNVIGGGDWSQDRLIPDCIKAWQQDERPIIRRPDAVRPWQHVLDPLAGYMRLAEGLWNDPSLAASYNFGPSVEDAVSVRTAISMSLESWGAGAEMVEYGNGSAGPEESGLLRLDCEKAHRVLGVTPRWPLRIAIARTIAWYKRLGEGAEAGDLCAEDIDYFERGRSEPL